MKRLILVLLVLVLLTGCGNAVKEFDLREKYGITIQISGYLSEMEDNRKDKFSFGTSLGTLEFRHFPDSQQPVNQETMKDYMQQNHAGNSSSLKELDNGAFFFSLPPYGDQEDTRYHIVEAYYFIQVGNDVWRIHCISPNAQYKEDALLTVLQSIQFVGNET